VHFVIDVTCRRSVALTVLIGCLPPACAPRAVRIPPPPPVIAAPPLPHALVPLPAAITLDERGPFVVTADAAIRITPATDELLRIGRMLAEIIGTSVADAPPPVLVAATGGAEPKSILLTLRPTPPAVDDSYELTVTPDMVTIVSGTGAGLFYGVQTLRQLLPPFLEFRAVRNAPVRPVTVRSLHIVDRPRFAWRGAMLDVARHFLTVGDVKRYIDLMTLYKLNRLHLHLADDQGWRIEIAAWPNLTTHGGSTQVGGGRGGFYTQREYRELVDYAADRFVTVVPEIDMPGHTNAALASYPQLNCDGQAPPLYTGIKVGFSALCVDTELTYTFLDDVIRELAAATPGPFIHIGGDEVKTLTAVQYASFIDRVHAIVRTHGKQMIGWDEIAAAATLDATTVVQYWHPDASPATVLARGARVVLSPANRMYLDMKYDARTPIGLTWAGLIDTRDAYDWDPAGLSGASNAAILGLEAPLWSETIMSIRDAEFLAFPRLAAIAEVAWSPAGARRWEEFKGRLAAHALRWSALGVNFYRSPQVPWPR
jgi:hexosaminidase